MATINLKGLVGKLDDTCRRGLEAAAGAAMSRGNYVVEIEHWLLKLIEAGNTDLHAIARHFDIDLAGVQAALTRALDRLKTGNSRAPALSPHIVSLAREAWLLASINGGAVRVRSAHLLLALLGDETLSQLARDVLGPLGRIGPEALEQSWPTAAAQSAEAAETQAARATEGAAAPASGAAGGPAGAGVLDQFTIDLTALAQAGKIDPVIGRDAEIRQVIDILTRRRQNNPILTGEAGVGKTAVVEGFALRIAAGDVPEPLKPVVVRTLDLGLLQAGASVKGEFENRLKSVIEAVKASPRPVILFIDEAHTMIGAGGQAGQNDAANLLKPALARGELRTIAATTWAEYKKYFERDAALARRFQVVKVEEPGEAAAREMMHGLVGMLERHHNVRILDEAVTEAVRLSHRYIAGRQLPDKSVSLLDTACARVAMSQGATPAAIEDISRRIAAIGARLDTLKREQAIGADHGEAVAELESRRTAARADLAALEARWRQEAELVREVHALRRTVEAALAAGDDAAAEDRRATLAARGADLKALQGEAPLVGVDVDANAVAEVVAGWTGIPVGRMVTNEIQAVLTLKDHMTRRVIGQDHALEAIARAVRTSRARLTDPRKPVGVFLLAGPSGVGKTETALTLAEALYGGEQNMTVINMSEFKEEHKVSMLVGAPPGYVGYGEGGVLTEAIRRRPYSVLLLDEIEKAHPGVQDVFFQVFDKGMLRDGEGRDIDFKNTLIIMTSNAGTDTIAKLCADPDTIPEPDALTEALMPDLLKSFKPAFLGRATVVPYFPLADDILRRIVALNLDRIARRLAETCRAGFSYAPELIEGIAGRCREASSGARNVETILTRSLLPELSAILLDRMAREEPVTRVEVGLDPQGAFTYSVQ